MSKRKLWKRLRKPGLRELSPEQVSKLRSAVQLPDAEAGAMPMSTAVLDTICIVYGLSPADLEIAHPDDLSLLSASALRTARLLGEAAECAETRDMSRVSLAGARERRSTSEALEAQIETLDGQLEELLDAVAQEHDTLADALEQTADRREEALDELDEWFVEQQEALDDQADEMRDRAEEDLEEAEEQLEEALEQLDDEKAKLDEALERLDDLEED